VCWRLYYTKQSIWHRLKEIFYFYTFTKGEFNEICRFQQNLLQWFFCVTVDNGQYTTSKNSSNAPKLKDTGNFFAVGRQFADEVVVTNIETAVTTACQRNRSHQSCLINTSITASTVDTTSITITQHRSHSPWPLLQVDISAITFVQDTCTRLFHYCTFTFSFHLPEASPSFHLPVSENYTLWIWVRD